MNVIDSSNPAQTGGALFTLNVAATPLTFHSSSLPSTLPAPSYTATVALDVTGGIAPYTYSLAAGSALPAGLSLSSSGVISGEATTAGTSTFAIKVVDSSNPQMSASAQFTITVNLLQSGTPLPTAYTGSAYSSTVATNQYYCCIAPYTFSLQEGSTLPAGLYLSSAGAITGTPTTAGTYNFIIDVLDSSNPQMSASAVFIINVDPGTSATGLLKGQYIYTFYSQLNLNLFYNLNEEAGQVYSVFHSYGVLTFDGNGSVAGTVYAMDDYQLAPGEPGLNVSAPVTGTYSVAADGSGSLLLPATVQSGSPTLKREI